MLGHHGSVTDPTNIHRPWQWEQSAEPSGSLVVAGQWWRDTDTGDIYRRNDGNTLWVLQFSPAAASGTDSTLNFVIDGNGAEIADGVKGDIVCDFAATIISATLLADQSGSIVVDIWKDSYANFPPTVADTITAAAKPTITTAVKSQDTTLTGWTTAITAGQILRFNVDSCTTIQRCTLALKVRRTA